MYYEKNIFTFLSERFSLSLSLSLSLFRLRRISLCSTLSLIVMLNLFQHLLFQHPVFSQQLSEPLKDISVLSGADVKGNGTTIIINGNVVAAGTVDTSIRATDTTIQQTQCVTRRAMDSLDAERERRKAQTGTQLQYPAIADTVFTSGVYEISSSLTLSKTITLTGDSSSVFVFNISGDLLLDANTQIILVGGVKPENIFFNVDGKITVGDSAVICGNFLADGSIYCLHDISAANARLLSADTVSFESARDTVGVPAESRIAVWGTTCECAMDLGPANICPNNFTMNGSEMWFSFLAEKSSSRFVLVFPQDSIIGQTYRLTIFSGSCDSLIEIITKDTTSNAPYLRLDVWDLVIGNIYYVKASRTIVSDSVNISLCYFPCKTTSTISGPCSTSTAQSCANPPPPLPVCTGETVLIYPYFQLPQVNNCLACSGTHTYWEIIITNMTTGTTSSYTISCNGTLQTSFPSTGIPSPPTQYCVTQIPLDANGNACMSQCVHKNCNCFIVYESFYLYVTATPNPVCLGECATLTANVTDGSGNFGYLWTPGGQTTSSIVVCPSVTTTYSVTVTDFNIPYLACCSTKTAAVTVVVSPLPIANAGSDQTICLGSSTSCVTIGGNPTASGGTPPYTYSWNPATGLSCTNCPNPIACPSVTTTYNVTVTDANGCSATDAVTVFVVPLPAANFIFNTNEDCMGNAFSFTDQSTNATQWLWDFGDPSSPNNTSTLQNPFHVYASPGQYVVTLTVQGASFSGCLCCDVYSALVSVTPKTSMYNANCCSNNAAYIQNLSPPAGMGPYSFEISASATNPFPFNQTPIIIRDTITVKTGATLTLQCLIVRFGPWGRIIVDPGATLYLKGTTLSSVCDMMWQGIEVWGDPTHSHANAFQQSFQGKLIMEGDICNSVLTATLIERAHNAVTLGKFADRFLPAQCCQPPPKTCRNGDYLTCLSGGILVAQPGTGGAFCEFKENAHNIRVAPYKYTNASKVDGCKFFGTVVRDPGYKIGAATYQYPDAANFYYALANPKGRTWRYAHIWEAQWNTAPTATPTFNQNTFLPIWSSSANDGAEIGIEIINGRCLITNNTFQNTNRGISGSYISPSPFLANKIKGNTFFNTIVQSYNAVTPPPVCGIYLNAGIGDRISNANNFGDVSLLAPQANNPIGIYLYNSSYFIILDNNFFRVKQGIWVLNSSANGGVIQRFTSGDGNFFPRNNNAIFTFFNNSALRIRCNTTDNDLPSPVYGVNWDNNIQIGNWVISFPLANQGLPAPLISQITLPAGNRFDFPLPVPRKEIRSKFPYTYYSHNNPPEYVPLNNPTNSNISVMPQTPSCPGFVQCCPTDNCLSETPPWWCINYPNRIGDVDQQISSLQTEFDSVFANLDKGQTTQLITAINSNMDAGQLKNTLLNNSFLSDETLLAFINRTATQTPPGIFKDVIIPNSPVSDNVMPALETKMNSLPPGIAMQIKDAQSSNAYRTLTNISREISALQVERQSVVNSILSVLVETDSAQAIALLEQENTVAADQILLGTYIAFGNLSAAQTKLASMTAGNAEEQAFFDLQGMLLNLFLQGRNEYQMDPTEEQLVRSIASMPSSLAQANACNLLYLVFKEHCPDPLTTLSLRMQEDNASSSPLGRIEEGWLGDNIPNPFNNTTVIPYSLPDGIEKAFINVYDITGKMLKSYEVHKPSPLGGESERGFLVISCGNMENGVYLYKLEANGTILGNKKMLIIK